jgi:hypothetical protein
MLSSVLYHGVSLASHNPDKSSWICITYDVLSKPYTYAIVVSIGNTYVMTASLQQVVIRLNRMESIDSNGINFDTRFWIAAYRKHLA